MFAQQKRTTTGTKQVPENIPLHYHYPPYEYMLPSSNNPVYMDPYTYPTPPYNKPVHMDPYMYPTPPYNNPVYIDPSMYPTPPYNNPVYIDPSMHRKPPYNNPVYIDPSMHSKPPYNNPVYIDPSMHSKPPYNNPVYIDPSMHPTPPYNNPGYIYYPQNEYGQIIGPPTNFPPIVNQHHQKYYPYYDYMSNIPTRGSYKHPPKKDRMLNEDYYYPHHPKSYHGYEKPRRESLPPIHRHPFASTRPALPNNGEFQQFLVRDLTERGSASSGLSNKDAIRRIKYYDKLRKNYH